MVLLLHIKTGEKIILSLHDSLQSSWTFTISDSGFLQRLPGGDVPQSAQAVYQAQNPGEVMITAYGEPACRKGNPPCKLLTRNIQIPVIIAQA